MPTKLPITLVVITLNEEANLSRCLESASFVDDLLVVDSFSTDKTEEIARAHGARFLQNAWQGYGPQKIFANAQAKHDWILSLDADEALSPELRTEILARFATLNPETGYEFPRRSFHLGRWIHHGGWYPDYQLRLFHRQHSDWSQASLHEKVQVKSKARFQSDLLHWVFKDLSHQVITNDRYSGLGATNLRARGRRFSLLKLVYKPWVKFIECYIVKLGFLDGLPGFIIAVGAGYSIFLRHAKLWEMEMNERRSKP
jgi:glycosyltransferase involved in cell wall biosynthesis